MNARSQLEIPSMQSKVSPEEWTARVDLAACYRLVADFGWDDLVFTHISARVPGTAGSIPDQSLRHDVRGNHRLQPDQGRCARATSSWSLPFPVNPAGFTIHSAVHGARHDIACVLHTHSLNGRGGIGAGGGAAAAVAAIHIHPGQPRYHNYEGVALRDEEKPRLTADLGDKTFLMLRNHGLLTVGETVADAFVSMYVFEAACAIQVRAQAGGGKLIPIACADHRRRSRRRPKR